MDIHAARNPRQSHRLLSERAAVLLTACCGVFFGFGSLFISTFGIFLKPVSESLGFSRAEISTGFTAAVLSVALMSPWIGRMLDRGPARRLVIPGLIIYGSAFASLALLTRHIWHLLAVYIVMGIVGNTTAQLGYARVVSAWYDQARGRALAALMAGSGLGFMIFPPAAQFLVSGCGWRTAYVALGASVLVAALPLVWLFLYEPAGVELRETPSVKHAAARADVFWRSRAFWGIAAALLLFSFASNGLLTHWPALLTDRGLSPAAAALVVSLCGMASLASKALTGPLLDRFRAHRVTALLLVFAAAGLVSILFGGRSFSLACLAAILVGFGMGAESDAVPYLLTRYFGLARFSELYGYTWMVYAVAGGTGPLLAGAVYDHAHSYRAALYLFIALVLGAVTLFASLPGYATLPAKPALYQRGEDSEMPASEPDALLN